MKKIFLTVLVPLLLMGCISSGVDVKVKSDGSGEVIQTFKIKRDFVGFLSMSEEPTDPNLIDMEALEMTAKAMGEGVELQKVEPMPEDSPYAGYKAYFSFDNIADVKVSATPSTTPEAGADDNGEWISFSFKKGAKKELTMYRQEKETPEEPEAVEEEVEGSADQGMEDQLKEIYKDMHYWMTIQIEGNITDTNALYADGSKVTVYDMNFEKIVENDELFKKVTSEDPGAMNTYKDELAAAGVLIDDQTEIKISFR